MSFTVAVVIVSYNTRESLRRCLSSLQGEADEVIVVDNASKDGSADMIAQEFPWVKLIRSEVNLGFGAGCNRGEAAAGTDLVLYLNSDAAALPGAVRKLAEVFGDPEVSAAGGMLINADADPTAVKEALDEHDAKAIRRLVQQSCASELDLWSVFCEQSLLEKAVPTSIFLSPYWRTHRLLIRGTGPFEVDQVMGACLMTRRQERFSEDFFLYCEDTELCSRLARHGKILYQPVAKFRHELGSSTGSNRWWAVAMYNRGKEHYFEIERGPWAAFICLLLNRGGAKLRLIGWLLFTPFKKRARSQMRLWWNVVTAPIKGPDLPPDALPRTDTR